jgi:hypothetical protein
MHKLILTIASAATLLAAGLTTSAGAVTLGNAAGLRPAIEDVAVTDKVHCRWGWQHHRWRFGHPTWDGCYRFRPYGYYNGPHYGFYGHFRGHRFHGHHFAVRHIHGHRFAGHHVRGHRFAGHHVRGHVGHRHAGHGHAIARSHFGGHGHGRRG